MSGRRDDETKKQEQYKKLLDNLLKLPENKRCADCGAAAPRWASGMLGIFICMKCAGVHRSMGTHISFVRSVTLDKWKEDDVQRMQEIGNARAAEIYEARVPKHYPRPNPGDNIALDKWIRDKYEFKRFYRSPSELPPKQQNSNNQVTAQPQLQKQQVPVQPRQTQAPLFLMDTAPQSNSQPQSQTAPSLFDPRTTPHNHQLQGPAPTSVPVDTKSNILSLFELGQPSNYQNHFPQQSFFPHAHPSHSHPPQNHLAQQHQHSHQQHQPPHSQHSQSQQHVQQPPHFSQQQHVQQSPHFSQQQVYSHQIQAQQVYNPNQVQGVQMHSQIPSNYPPQISPYPTNATTHVASNNHFSFGALQNANTQSQGNLHPNGTQYQNSAAPVAVGNPQSFQNHSDPFDLLNKINSMGQERRKQEFSVFGATQL